MIPFVLLLGGTAAVVFLVDPFFHYHAPWFGLKAVEDEKEYQIQGMIDHFSYDSVLAGSSVVMSMDLQELDREFSCNAIKAVGGSAPAPLLAWYLERAFARQELRYVFYGLDVFSFYNDPDMPVIDEDVSYLVNANPFDDVRYLWNKDIIYSKRTGTPAASMEDQVPEEVVREGFDKLLKVVQDTARERAALLQGKVMEALVEEVNEQDPSLMTGRLSNNMLVHFPASESMIGKLVNVSLDICHGFYYTGHIVD